MAAGIGQTSEWRSLRSDLILFICRKDFVNCDGGHLGVHGGAQGWRRVDLVGVMRWRNSQFGVTGVTGFGFLRTDEPVEREKPRRAGESARLRDDALPFVVGAASQFCLNVRDWDHGWGGAASIKSF